MVAVLLSVMLLFRLGSGMLFGVILHLGMLGVWMAMGMDWLARSVAFTLRYKSGKWKTFKIINERRYQERKRMGTGFLSSSLLITNAYIHIFT